MIQPRLLNTKYASPARIGLRRAVCGALGAVLCAFAAVLPAAAGPASEPVEQFNATLLEAMRNADELGLEGRYRLLQPVISRVFHLRAMAQISAGSYWRGLGEVERDRLADTFARMSITTYATRFSGYDGERFEVLGERPALRGSVLVENKIVKADGEAVPLNYVLHEFDGTWRIVDVILDAKYSELAVKRSEFTSVLKSKGIDELIARLDKRIADMETDAAN